jgi:hypothetical protein
METGSASDYTVNHRLTDLGSTEDVQLLIHLCSNVAISSGLSILRRLSTLAPSFPVNETSIRLRYSGISSRFGLSRPTRLRERGLYLLTQERRERASEALRLSDWSGYVGCCVSGTGLQSGRGTYELFEVFFEV